MCNFFKGPAPDILYVHEYIIIKREGECPTFTGVGKIIEDSGFGGANSFHEHHI